MIQRQLLTLILAALLLSACSSTQYSLHDAAIDREIRKAGLEAGEINVNGKDIAYLESDGRGEQPALVLVHGFGGDSNNWLRLSRQLNGDYHIVVPDLPGHGNSTQDPALEYGIPDQVEYLAAILRALEVPEAHMAGNSMGGAIVTLYAARFPEQVNSLSLINPAGVHEHPSELDGYLDKGENPLVVNQPSDYSDLLDFVMEKRPFIPWPVSSVMAEKAAANRDINQKIFADMRAGSMDEFREALPQVKAPTLILWGGKDRVISADNAQVFDALIPDSRVVIFDDIGHVPMIEVPDRTADAMRVLLQRAPDQPEMAQQ